MADRNQSKAAAAAKDGTKPGDPAPKETVLTDSNSVPSVTVPGDAPFDTTDPSERASTVLPNPGDQALLEGTVNGVRKLPSASAEDGDGGKGHRIEHYEARKPDGSLVRVEHNLDTGETKLA